MSLRGLGKWAPALVLGVMLGGCSTVTGWFSIDDDEDPRQPVELEKIEESVDVRKLWSAGVGDGQGKGLYKITPAIAGDTIYAASAEGEVAAYNRLTGKRAWEVDLKEALSGGVGVHDNALFLGASDGYVLRLDARSGQIQWRSGVKGEVLAAPQANGRVVVVQTYDGKLHGLDYADGKRLWVYDSNMPVLTIRGTSTPILSDNQAIAGFANGRVIAFNAGTGGIEWEARVAIPEGRSEIERMVDIDGSMALAGSELYAASYQGNIVAIDVPSGRKRWEVEMSSVSGVSLGFGNVYAAAEDGTVYAFLRNGQGQRWSQEALGWRGLGRPVPVSSYLAVPDFEGFVHILSQVDGRFVARVKSDGKGVRADMLSEGNILYVFGNSGKLIAYELSSKAR